MIAAAILLTVIVTAVISGVLGMAGGLILMVVLASVLPVSAAMILHGAVQATSNGARFVFLRDRMMWSVLPWYAAGAALAVLLFVSVAFVPDPALVLIIVGSFPWLARLLPMLRGLDVRKRGTATVCGATVTGAQLLAGASGPLLDAFYLETDVDRRSIVATKAFTQTVGHVIKVGYYVWISTRVLPDVESLRLSPFPDRGRDAARRRRRPDRHAPTRPVRRPAVPAGHRAGHPGPRRAGRGTGGCAACWRLASEAPRRWPVSCIEVVRHLSMIWMHDTTRRPALRPDSGGLP